MITIDHLVERVKCGRVESSFFLSIYSYFALSLLLYTTLINTQRLVLPFSRLTYGRAVGSAGQDLDVTRGVTL